VAKNSGKAKNSSNRKEATQKGVKSPVEKATKRPIPKSPKGAAKKVDAKTTQRQVSKPEKGPAEKKAGVGKKSIAAEQKALARKGLPEKETPADKMTVAEKKTQPQLKAEPQKTIAAEQTHVEETTAGVPPAASEPASEQVARPARTWVVWQDGRGVWIGSVEEYKQSKRPETIVCDIIDSGNDRDYHAFQRAVQVAQVLRQTYANCVKPWLHYDDRVQELRIKQWQERLRAMELGVGQLQ
jgi:hypothetical protein